MVRLLYTKDIISYQLQTDSYDFDLSNLDFDDNFPKIDSAFISDRGILRAWSVFAKNTDYLDWLYKFTDSNELKEITDAIDGVLKKQPSNFHLERIHILPPTRIINTLRDFYAFEEHVKIARSKRGLTMISEWYEFPVFYFSNPRSIFGCDLIPYPKPTQELDFELEVAAIIGKPGINIPVEEADSYIAGYTIMNDWSARDIQRKEMAVGLGPAKSKDFATSLGPYIVTPDELEDRRSGKGYDLEMVARRNGKEISRGNWKSIYWSFAEMIARASEDTMLYPGDVIGSGTVGTGCILELGAENVGGWLQPGDVIELEVERLGVLRNTIGE